MSRRFLYKNTLTIVKLNLCTICVTHHKNNRTYRVCFFGAPFPSDPKVHAPETEGFEEAENTPP
jgi:hypothetical protein